MIRKRNSKYADAPRFRIQMKGSNSGRRGSEFRAIQTRGRGGGAILTRDPICTVAKLVLNFDQEKFIRRQTEE